jgi:hypothetical protein
MPYVDLLRITVLLTAAVATALAAVAVIAAHNGGDETALVVAAAWWAIAIAIGAYLGRPAAAADGVRDALTRARTATSLPRETPARIALGRLWPVGVFAVVCGAVAWLWPQVPIVGAGYAIAVALTSRSREAAVTAIEERDGVRFYVEPSSVLEPVRLVRTPGLGRDRMPAGHPPPPPPATS